MRLSLESTKQRWTVLVLLWSAIGVLVFAHAHLVQQYLELITNMGRRPATPLTQGYPAFAADAQTWVRHALSLLEGDDVRLRFTTMDNAPVGREVHWNSAWAWTIAGAGYLERWFTQKPIGPSIEHAIVWLMPTVFLALIVLISSWVGRRAGVLAAAFVALAMVGHPRLAEGFFPSYVDHHGLLTVAVLGMFLGTLFMGVGWWKKEGGPSTLFPERSEIAGEAAVFSALCGAAGMWVSAASTIPAIAIVGVSAVVTILVSARSANSVEVTFDPAVWRLWARVGGTASLIFYLVEYFPNHLGFRLESNHPLYAIAWVGGGELVAEFGRRWLGPLSQRWHRPFPVVLALFCVVLPALVIGAAKSSVFVVADPFLARLHQLYIQEFLPLSTALKGGTWISVTNIVGLENIPLVVGLGLFVVRRTACHPVLIFSTVSVVLFTAMAWIQSRWLMNACGAQIGLALLLVVSWVGDKTRAVRLSITLGAVFVMFWPSVIVRFKGAMNDVAARRVAPKDANSALFRDIAAALRTSSPNEEVILLTQPNASTAVGYYGRFKTIGTLYWENVAGLKAAAGIFSARSMEEAAQLVRDRRITHIAIISEENFIEQYNRLLHPEITDAELQNSFGYQLLIKRAIPTWLRMIAYKVPSDLEALKMDVLLFKVAFDQSPADALYHIAMGKIALGALEAAEADLDTLIKLTPESHQPWIQKAELQFARKNWADAAQNMIEGIRRSPEAERPALYVNSASSFYRAKRPAEATRIYRAALAERYDPTIASYLAFLLATTTDDALREGAEALTWANKAQQSLPDSASILHALAAALAENGRFDEAVAAVEKALALAREKGEKSIIALSERRIAIFRERKPLRE